ncbi:hypothetical protein DEO72_LG6g810 [Vigna unguiculata]|uniref:Uncharacterized protein n=1 Tax=Vigna unguiculata TaxID=3917 RepID=A0A4D6M6F4_VIGUN|nr:hypothetical protein DEO72_LG6g810 [Vigna unguiculata]
MASSSSRPKRMKRTIFQEQFAYQSLEKFVQLRGIYYPDLLKVFYANAREENGIVVSRVTKLLKYHHIADKDDGLDENVANTTSKSASDTSEDDSTDEEEDHTMAKAIDSVVVSCCSHNSIQHLNAKVTKLLKYHHIADKDDGLDENVANTTSKSASDTSEDDSTDEEEDHTMAKAIDSVVGAATDDENYSTTDDMSD